jgi:carbamoyl-phosphate synthase large subunit
VNAKQALEVAERVGYPLVARPSYVLGGRAMEVIHGQDELRKYVDAHKEHIRGDAPVLFDRFLDLAVEVDVDAVSDGKNVVIGGLMEHIEQAGVHSGDSACALPPYSLSQEAQAQMRGIVKRLAREFKVIGLINVQFAVQNGLIYVLEVNPRASRTIPFISKAIGVSLAAVAVDCMLGHSLKKQGFTEERIPRLSFVKESVFPFNKFLGVDPILGPEMKSTGEVMGIGKSFTEAFGRAGMATGAGRLPKPREQGRKMAALLSVRDADRQALPKLAAKLIDLDFKLYATRGNARHLEANGYKVELINKVMEGRPHAVDLIKNRQVQFIVNTSEGKQSIADSAAIRQSALQLGIAYTTTIAAALASCDVMASDTDAQKAEVRCLQTITAGDYYDNAPDMEI